VSNARQFRDYRTVGGARPFQNELDGLQAAGRAALVAAMRRYERDEQFPREVKALTGTKLRVSGGKTYQLWEVRVSVGNNPYRVLFAHLGRFVLVCLAVSAIYKNQEKLPAADRERAVERLRDWVVTQKKC
jgi:hypothetical protein